MSPQTYPSKPGFTPATRRSVKRRLKPYLQGQLDAFCGVYCVVNAVHYLCGPITPSHAEALFLKLMKYLEHSRSVMRRLSKGTRIKEISKVLDNIIIKDYPIRKLKPFNHNITVTLDELWCDLKEFLSDENSIVILGMDGKHGHWSLVRKVTNNSLLLFDSDGLQRLSKRHCSTNENNNCLHVLYPTKVLFLWLDYKGGSNE